MLWVNLIMDTFAALALASLPPNSIVMTDKPRRSTDSIISRPMMWFIIGFGVLFATFMITGFYYLLHMHGDHMIHQFLDKKEVAFYFSTFVFLQFWNMFNARAFMSGHSAFHNIGGSKVFFAVIAVIFVGHILIVQLGGAMFGCAPMGLREWAMVIGGTAPVMLIPEIYRIIKH